MLPYEKAATLDRASALTMTLKRCVDITVSTTAIVMLLPLFAMIAVAIKADSPGPVFFLQTRVGRNGRLFKIRKFRSMVVDAARYGGALTLRHDDRVTRVGRFIRKHKLDELPQLTNVIAGDMSLVGPRPEVPELMQFYTPEQVELVCSVRPGITDYASLLFCDESALLAQDEDPVQVYRRAIMPAKLRYYERYIQEIGLLTDVRIILATVALLVFGRIPRRSGSGSDVARRRLQEASPSTMEG
jgi:lipopolysaccharide/colanic/teichoic acid biosynthesis glycosyltransferase